MAFADYHESLGVRLMYCVPIDLGTLAIQER